MPRTPSDKNDTRQITVVQALKMESETLKDLDHPHIVQYLGFEETPTNLSMYVQPASVRTQNNKLPASWSTFLEAQSEVVF